jgi:hypothetical protein
VEGVRDGAAGVAGGGGGTVSGSLPRCSDAISRAITRDILNAKVGP